MKRDVLQGQSSSRNVWSATEYDSEDLTQFSRNPALFIVLNPAGASTFRIDRLNSVLFGPVPLTALTP